jgi:hypothetical protein
MASKRDAYGKSRFGELRSMGYGSAYDTAGREAFDTKVTITFDYSDLDIKSRDVKKAVSDFSQYVFELDKKYGIKKANNEFTFDVSPNAGSAVAAGGAQGNRSSVGFPLLADGLRIQQVLKSEMAEIGKEGRGIMRKYANRRDTGRMNESIRYNARARGNTYVINIGWTELWFKYFGYQENGTKYVKPMHSIIRTYMHMLPKIQNYTSRLYREYTLGDGDFLGGKGPKY